MALTQRDRRALIILGVVAVVAAVVGFLVLGGGGADEDTAPTPTVSPSPQPTVPVGPDEDEPPPRFTFFGGRDPFEALIVAPIETDGDGTGTNGDTDGNGTTDGNGDGTGTDGDGGDGDGGDGDGQQESITVGGHTVTLIDIFTQGGQVKVQVEVDGETFVVEPGDTFSGNFKLVSVQGGCANFVFGDQSFTLCEPGERK